MLTLASIAFAEPAADAPPDDPFVGWLDETLPNGARIWFKALPADPRVRVAAFVGVGAREDPVGKEGLAHLTEHVRLFQSSRDLDEEGVEDRLREHDALTNGVTDSDDTRYYVDVPRAHVHFALDELVDRVAVQVPVTPSHVDAERRSILLEKELVPVTWAPWTLLPPRTRPDKLEADLGLDPVRVRSRAATWQSLHALSAEDVSAFWDTWYGPGNLTFVVTGGADPDDVLPHLRRRLQLLTDHGRPAPGPIPAHPSGRLDLRYATRDEGTARVAVRWRVPGLDERDYALTLLLAGVLQTLMYEELRVRRKTAYDVDSSTRIQWGHATVGVSAEVRPDAVDESRDAVVRAFERIRGDDLPDDEWVRLRDEALARRVRANSTRGELFEWLDTVHVREVFPRFPPVTTLARVDRSEMAAWVNERVVPYGRTERIERAIPGFNALSVGAGWGVAAALLSGLRWFGRARIELPRLRYLRRLRWMPESVLGFAVSGLVVSFAALPALARLEDGVLETAARVDSAIVHGVAIDLVAWLVGLPLVVMVLFVPRKILLFEHEMRIKALGPWSFGVPWRRVTDVRRCRALEVVRAGHALRCLFCVPSPFREGVLIRVGRWSIFLHTRDDAELVDVLGELRRRAAGDAGSVVDRDQADGA